MATTAAAPVTLPTNQFGSGFGWRVAVSITTVFGLVSFLLLYFAFWAHLFNGVQSAVVVLVSLLAFVAANGAAWASWGIRNAPPPEA